VVTGEVEVLQRRGSCVTRQSLTHYPFVRPATSRETYAPRPSDVGMPVEYVRYHGQTHVAMKMSPAAAAS
jgi:hypothetical protein